jgi:hypothetical protein
MRSRTLLLCAVLLAPGALPAQAEEGGTPKARAGDTINWAATLEAAFEKAEKLGRPVMICINSRRVDGGREEPAAKGLREVVYKDLTIVGKSREFVCVFLTSEGSSSDYGELRLRFGIDGLIVSPQHIFADPGHEPGQDPLLRKEYWPYGQGAGAVKALGEMMDKALVRFRERAGVPTTPQTPEAPDSGGAHPDGGIEAPAVPEDDDARKQWIERMIAIVKNGVQGKRREALALLVTSDKDGDCIGPVVALLVELEANEDAMAALIDVVRAVGRPGLEAAAAKVNDYLKHKDDLLRANAAVSLEYIGSATSVAPLKARVKREKDEKIANHMYRALGRCGAGDTKVRALLLKKSEAAKSNEASYGPIVGLAYFEKDAKTARGVEKLLKKMGPGGGRRGWGNALRRSLLVWTLVQIGDPKSEEFMLERMIEPLANANSRWIGPVRDYYAAAARTLKGEEASRSAVDEGARRTISFVGGSEAYRDEARKDRDISMFEPKADWDVEGRDWGGRGGRGGGDSDD